jgi:hypothetical protein
MRWRNCFHQKGNGRKKNIFRSTPIALSSCQTAAFEFWIIDPKLQEITVLKLVGTTYEVASISHRGDQAVSVLLPGFAVDVTAAFDAK